MGNREVLTHNMCGRRGNEETRADVDAQRDKIQAENPEWVHVGGGTRDGKPLKEMYITGPDKQRKGSTYPDLSFKKPDGTFHHHNTQDTYADGTATKREAANEARLQQHRPDDTVSSSAKPKKKR